MNSPACSEACVSRPLLAFLKYLFLFIYLIILHKRLALHHIGSEANLDGYLNVCITSFFILSVTDLLFCKVCVMTFAKYQQ